MIFVQPFIIFFIPGDQLDGLQFHLPGAGLNDSQSDGNITQDEIIDHGNHDDEDNLQLSALQEYINMIDDDGEESGEDTWQIQWRILIYSCPWARFLKGRLALIQD